MSIARMFVAVCLAVTSVGMGCAASTEEQASVATEAEALRVDCAAVMCADPNCGEGQHLAYQGSCCPTCVGRPDRCATVMCLTVECPEGEQRVYNGGDCCGRCMPTPPVKECSTDLDCPQYYCIACPCPISECVGNKCVTRTPSATTCGGAL
jgi:hypothetical protein